MGRSCLAKADNKQVFFFFLVSTIKVAFRNTLTVWQLHLYLPGQDEPVFHGLLGSLI